MNKDKLDNNGSLSKEARKTIKREYKEVLRKQDELQRKLQAEEEERWRADMEERRREVRATIENEHAGGQQPGSGAAIAKFLVGSIVVFSLLSVVVIPACSDYKSSTPDNKAEIERCIKDLNSGVYVIDKYYFKGRAPDDSDYDKLKIGEREDLVSAIDYAKSDLETVVNDGKIRKDRVNFSDEYRCQEDEIRGRYERARLKISRRDEEERLDEMNKKIDSALDGVIDEYKRKAVRHTLLGGPGARVDAFEMKDGSTVFCKTTITNAGKAVSCN